VTVAAEFVSRLARLAARSRPPRIRALHLPPPGAEGRAGEFCAVELEDGSIGLSFVLLDDTLARVRERAEAWRLHGADALEVARGFAGGSGAERTVGFAAGNALTAWFFGRAGFAPGPAPDSIGLLEPGPGDHVGMIGLFPPLVGRIVQSGARLTVVELRQDLVGEHEGYGVTLDAGALAACNKVLSTSTVLLNDSLDRMLACCAGARTLAVVGPGAGCLPDPLFERGVTLVGSAWIVEPAAFLEALGAGRSWGTTTRKCALRRDAYPGFDALLARVAGG
jgi:uncharacterized protein (DUF4213/DUF364 family)